MRAPGDLPRDEVAADVASRPLDRPTALPLQGIATETDAAASHVENRAGRKTVYLVVGNHNSFDGIYDIAHIVSGVLSKHYDIAVSYGIRPGNINVLIDEFSSQAISRYLVQAKRECPSTRLVVVATEFVTPIRLLGVRLGLSFNLTSSYRNLWTNAISHYAARSIPSRYPYMHSRFMGFSAVMELADLVVSIAPAVADSLSFLKGTRDVPKAILYPEINLDLAAVSESMKNLPFGFVLTGTLTNYRARIVGEMNRAFRNYRTNIFSATRFSDSQGPGRGTQFAYPYKSPEVLFNLNPPQQLYKPIARHSLQGICHGCACNGHSLADKNCARVVGKKVHGTRQFVKVLHGILRTVLSRRHPREDIWWRSGSS